MSVSRTSLLACAALAALPSTQAPNPDSARLTPAQWRADIAWLDSTIRAVHPAPYHRVPRARFDSSFRALLRDVPRLGDQAVALRMTAIVALLNDGHSHLLLRAPVFAREDAFPVRLGYFADGIHVVATRSSEARLLGGRVLRIGPLGAAAAWDSLMVMASGDNIFSRMNSVPVLLGVPELMRGLGLAGRDSLPLIVLTPGGDTVRALVPAVPAAGVAGVTRSVAGSGGSAELVERHRKMPYWYAEQGRMLYVQINQVGDSPDTVRLGEASAVASLADFSRRVMERIDAGGINRLVLDLRYNGGGNNALARPFVEGVAARPAINARGSFFVITGRTTYSAAMNFTSMLEDRTEALFVGEPPGGAPRHYGDAVPLTLPNSKLVLRLSTLHWDTGVPPSDVREVMEPDLPAPPRFADLVAGRDAPLEAIERYREGAAPGERMLSRYRESGFDAAVAVYDSTRSGVTAAEAASPWGSQVQALVGFAYGVIPVARAREDIFRAFAFATDRYPDSHVAWAERARVHGFVNDWTGARAAYEKALALRPANELIRRSYEAARRR